MTRQRAIDAVQQAVALQQQREAFRRLIGRWKLPSGLAFTVKSIDAQTNLALCRVNERAWNVPISDLLTLLDQKKLTFLGR